MEENSDKFVIQLLIGKQVYPITVRRDQEEVYRKASRMINEKLARYEQSYPTLGSPSATRQLALLHFRRASVASAGTKGSDSLYRNCRTTEGRNLAVAFWYSG